MSDYKELKVKPIKNGTVIDHINSNRGLNVLNILSLPDDNTSVTLALNVESQHIGLKDIVKVESRELSEEEVEKIILIAPNATLNIIRDYKIIKKSKLNLMNEVSGVVKCQNPNCITRTNEPITSKFSVIHKKPTLLRCHYCEQTMNIDDIESQLKKSN
ncbi:MAG: aspartate carbamoyltransferase regulatory subunit [Methanobacteriaceae archaeon]|nr:aspartate carbamoyltransferase regulatory subunit [Methanobacteriaceae archaeon]